MHWNGYVGETGGMGGALGREGPNAVAVMAVCPRGGHS